MATEDQNEMEEPPEAFSMVWVKMEVDEEGTVEGLEEDDNQDEEYLPGSSREHAPATRNRRKATTPKKSAPVRPAPKIYSCDYCDYQVGFKNALKYHTMKHTNEPPITCKFCNYTTKYPNSMKQHVLGQHTDKDDPVLLSLPIFTCKKCDYTTRFKWNLAVHQRKHATEKKFQCDDCGFGSVHRYSFVKHIKRHMCRGNMGFMYQCDKCPFKTKFEGHISRHLAQIHKEVSEKASKCLYCEFSCRVKWRLNTHVNRSRQSEPVVCEYCDFTTQYMCELKLHKRGHSKGPPEIDPDALRVSEFSRMSEELLPLSFAVNETPKEIRKTKESQNAAFAPTQTDKDYIIDSNSEEIDWRSIEVTEKVGDEKSFHCKECDYKAKYKASVQRHFQRLHTNKHLKPYKCVHCDFATKTQDQISLHVKRSRTHCLISCRTCNFSTYFKCQYASHEKIHYPLKCNLCDFSCKHNSHMHEHFSVVHLGNALRCKYCDFEASTKYKLINHEVKHTSARQYPCNLCGYTAKKQKLLLNHVKSNHSGERIVPTIIDDKKFESLKTINDRQNADNLLTNLNKAVQKQIELFKQQLKTTDQDNDSKNSDDENKPESEDNFDNDNESQQQNEPESESDNVKLTNNSKEQLKNYLSQKQKKFESELINIECQLKNIESPDRFDSKLSDSEIQSETLNSQGSVFENRDKLSELDDFNVEVKFENLQEDDQVYEGPGRYEMPNMYKNSSEMHIYSDASQNMESSNIMRAAARNNSFYTSI